MSCPAVIRVTTKTGPPGIGLPAGATGQDGFAIVKDGNTPYQYKLIAPSEVGLPQALGFTASPTFAGLTLSGLQDYTQGLAAVGVSGAIQRISIGSGLSIVNGVLVASAAAGTNLSYDVNTRILSSSTGDDVTLPLATLTTAGLLPPMTGPLTFNDITVSNTLTAPHIHGAIAGPVYTHVRNDAGIILPAGCPIHIVDNVGDTERVRVIRARADDASTMPANGILLGELAINGDGHAIVVGEINGQNTGGFTAGAQVWVSATGTLTMTRPAVNPQVIATVGRVHASTGSLLVNCSPILSTAAFTGVYGDLLGRPPETSQVDAEAGSSIIFGLWSPFRLRQAIAAWWQSITGVTGRALATATTAAEARATLQLGTAAQAATTDFATAAQGALAATAVQPAALSFGLAGKADLVGGMVPSVQLPSYVDDVLEFINFAAFPATGEAGKLYISLETNRQYRWSGSIYIEINPSPGSTDAVPEGSVNLYFTSIRGQAAAADWWAISASKTKLDGIAAGATVNSTDAALRDRSTHTGTQPFSTISNAPTTLNGYGITDAVSSAATRIANTFYGGPSSGGAAPGAFRALVVSDLPTIGTSNQVIYNNTGTLASASGLVIDLTTGRLTLASFLPGSVPATPATGFSVYADNSGRFSWIGSNGFTRTFDATGITAARIWTPPDRNGEIALTNRQRITLAPVAGVYTIDVETSGMRIIDLGTINGNVTINLANGTTAITSSVPANIPVGTLWEAVIRFVWTSGAITYLAANTGLARRLMSADLTAPTSGKEYEILLSHERGDTLMRWRQVGAQQ